MQFDDAFDQRQTKPYAARLRRSRRVRPIEAVEDERKMLSRDATAGVVNLNLHRAAIAGRVPGDPAAARRVGQCIGNQVAQGTLEQVSIRSARIPGKTLVISATFASSASAS